LDVKVNTAKVAGRRHVHFESIDEVLAEVERIRTADQDGVLETLGNWSAGQILAHVAAWIEYGYSGYPLKAPPFPLNWILRWMGKRMLKTGMNPGVRIPNVKEGTFGQDVMDVGEAADRLSRALVRLKNGEQCQYDSPAFGPMSHEDRIKLNLRHAELHLGFIRY
jgi:hypothetical protein